jgi:hypothetical protein
MDEGVTEEIRIGDWFWEETLRVGTMSNDELARRRAQLEAISGQAERDYIAALESEVVTGTLTAEQAAAEYADFRRKLRAIDGEAATLAAKARSPHDQRARAAKLRHYPPLSPACPTPQDGCCLASLMSCVSSANHP